MRCFIVENVVKCYLKFSSSGLISHHLIYTLDVSSLVFLSTFFSLQQAKKQGLRSSFALSSQLSKLLIRQSTPTPSLSTITNKPNNKLQVTLPKFNKTHLIALSSTTFKSLYLLTAASFTFTLPLLAEEIEKLSHSLRLQPNSPNHNDKIWFMPLGKFMDERDVAIREKLSNVKDTSKEVKQLEEQLAAVMRAARAEIGFRFLFPNQLGLHLKFSSITLILVRELMLTIRSSLINLL
ncbi:hypothetical protein K2173_022139 [Erythroxylum novogranatense]|uniref:Uncharacterized protein n=1 Tax=Erythroxylum novogranatense TaxID=1862640 RepID=A0AAV8STH1_9ROSI|nr:hypothetical protein K2173_022139 [Erythroxylum novogranatense]